MTLNQKNIQIYQEIGPQVVKGDSCDLEVSFKGFDSFTAKKHVINCAKFFLRPNNWLFEKFLDFNLIIGKVEYLNKVIFNQKPKTPEREVSELINGNMEIFKEIDFLSNENEQSGEERPFFKKLKYSEYNPPMGEAKLQGDLLYLDLETLEGKTLCLTLNKNGCFQNSSDEDNFNRKPATNTFFSLFELLSEVSSEFKK